MAGFDNNNITLFTVNGTRNASGIQNTFHNKVYFSMFTIILFTIGKIFLKGKFNSYSKSKLKNTILKFIKLRKKKCFLFIFPKIVLLLLVSVSYDYDNPENSRTIRNIPSTHYSQKYIFTSNPNIRSILNNHLFSQEYISASDQIQQKKLMSNMYLFALTKLKVKNDGTFLKYLLLLSGDVSLNPGPEFSCGSCHRAVASRHRVLCCQTCNIWIHKKCANVTDTMYQNIKKSPNMFSFQCKNCENLLSNLPFFNEDEHSNTNIETFEEAPVNENIDIDLNDDEQYQHFKNNGLHFIHLNINSILSKIDQLLLIALITNAAIIGLSESKLDETVSDDEILINGYTLLRSDRNRHGGGVACYVRTDLFFNKREIFSRETENLFFDIFLPKTKPILIGILYRPPDQSGFLKNLFKFDKRY